MVEKIRNLTKVKKRVLILSLTVTVLFMLPAIALSWPTNHVDSSLSGNKPYCTSCHSYTTGYVNLEKINGNTPLNASVTVNRNSSFTIDFRTVGLGYGRFTVAGAVQVPDTSKWYLSAKSGGDVPWMIAEQDTKWGAPVNSPYMWVTAFSENSNPTAQRGVTLDDGTGPPAPFVDRNNTAHDEPFSVEVFVYDSVPFGTYTLKLWGIGTASNGVLGYNEKLITVNVTNDTTPPTAPANMTFSGATTSSLNLSWDPSTDESGINGYELYRSTSSMGPFEYIGYANSASYSDHDLLAGTTYYYKLNAKDNAGNSAWGGTWNGTTSTGSRSDTNPPAVPTGISAFLIPVQDDVYKKTVKLTWNGNLEGDVAGYYVYRASSATGSYAPITANLVTSRETVTVNVAENIVMNTVYYVDTQVRFGTTYYYKVLAVDTTGNLSGMTSYVAATPAVDIGSPDPHGRYKSKGGMCQNCHSIHTSDGKALIFKNSITDSCYTCHDGSQSKYNTKAAFNPTTNPSHHKIPEGRYSCDVCHNPHYNSTDHPRLLAAVSKEDGQIKRSGNEFCYACHGQNSDLRNPFGRDHHTAFAVSKHNTLSPSSQATGIVCRNCHTPHGSRDYPLLVSANSDNFCISCHKNVGFTQTRVLTDPSEGSVFTGVYLNNFSNDYLGTKHHQNFYGRNTCTMCHDPHGSVSNRYMMMYPYKDYWKTTTVSGKVYGPVDYAGGAEENMICFRCHDSQYYVGINGDYNQVTIGSKFGNGNAKNYHYHASKWKLSCRACHDPHSGKSMFQNLSKPAGYEWNLNNDLYVNFDWAVQVGIATYSSYNNRLAFIPGYDLNFNINSYSCAIKCHGKDHSLGSGKFLSYNRTTTSPNVKCNGCHDFDAFDTASRHPVLGPISPGGNTVNCEMCHIADHAQHNKTNPYGLVEEVRTGWAVDGTPGPLPNTFDPVTGKEIPAYKEFCWQCHGATPGRNILGDHKTQFIGKPHANLERTGKDNPYGPGLDAPCLTCHSHHSSTNMRLLRKTIDGVAIDAETITGKLNACLACHDGSPAPMDIASKYNAASSAGHFIKSDPSKKLLCTECHDSHGSTNKMYLLDTNNKYNTGVNFEGGHTEAATRWLCLACHPLYNDPNRSQVAYNTANTVVAGVVYIQQLPSTVQDHVYNSGTARECTICHDPHKPWPATGGEDKCYSCHSRPNGEATDIKSLMGLRSQPGTGLLSHHPITDADTVNNTCSADCHTNHPHAIRAQHLKSFTEKDLCLSCHDKNVDPEVNPKKSPYVIDGVMYNLHPHNYDKVIRVYPADDSAFLGNCDKCHVPHGSDFRPMLRKRKDELCVGCHNGQETDGGGNVIKDIKTLYQNAGHYYTDFPTAKMYCDECHIPHGSTNDNYLRDSMEFAPRQSITAVSEGVQTKVYFPDNLIGAGYNTRFFCTTCHKEYGSVYSSVYYSSETTPGGQVTIRTIPLIGDHGVQIDDHRIGKTKACTECHNPHDREPFGNNETCFICHGSTGYATQIENLTGLNGVWPAGVTSKQSYHPIRDVNTAGNNDCMNMCHTKHVHNPRANLIIDKRPWVNDITAPTGPVAYAIASSANQVDLKVYAPSDTDVVGYYVYRSVDNVTWQKYGIVNNKVQAPGYFWFYDGGLTNGMTVYYKVQAFDKKGNLSAVSDVTSVTTSQASDTTKPDIPLNVTAALNTRVEMQSTSIVVNWTPSKDNYELRKYNIYRANYTVGQSISEKDLEAAEPGMTYTYIGSTGATSFTDASLAEKTTYLYRVTAVDANGNESAKSAWVYAVTNPVNAVVKAGYYYYPAGSDTIYMHIFKPEDTSMTPTTTFMNGGSIKVKLDVPKGYFNFGAVDATKDIKQAKLTMYPDSSPEDNILGSFSTEQTATRDIYYWVGQVPSGSGNCSVYQLTVNMGVYEQDIGPTRYYSRQILNKESIYVVPTNRYMKSYSDAARTTECLTFKPGDTVYMTGPSDYPTSGYNSATVWMYTYEGKSVGLGGSVAPTAANYDGNTGEVKFQLTLPATGLVNDSWYYAGASAKNGWVNTKVIDIGQQILVRSPDTSAPAAPSGLTVTGTDQNKVSLSWSGSTDNVGVVGYYVYYKKSTDTQYYLAGTTGSDTLAYDVTGLDPGATYNFKVAAFDAASNDSAFSTVVNQDAPAEAVDNQAPNLPSSVRLVVNSAFSITASWDWNNTSRQDKVTAYSVYRSQNNIDWFKLGSIGSVGLTSDCRVSFTDNNLTDNTKYYYKVMGHDKAGNNSDFSVVVNAKTKSSGENSVEGALCMSCHDGVQVPPAGYTVNHKIGTAYNQSKHNVDWDILTFKDGSVYRGNCTKCHVPHGSDYKSLLKADDDANLCFICHESASESGKYSGKRDYILSAHGQNESSSYQYSSTTPRYWPGGVGPDSSVPAKTPADAGACSNCHAPHGRYDPETGQYIKSSAWAGSGTNLNRLCFTCHSDDPGTFFGEWHGKTVYSTTYHGDPSTNAKMRLTDSLGVQWGPGECTNCHDPHGTQYPGILRYPVQASGSQKNQLCLKCHDDPNIIADTGLFDGSAVYNASKHGQKAQWLSDFNVGGVVYNKTEFLPGVCLNCHNSHGKTTDNSADPDKVIKEMLVIEDGPNNEICNKCHEYASTKASVPGYFGRATFEQSAHHGGGGRPGVLWPGGTYYTEPQSEDRRGKCINCHDPHGTAKRDWYGNVIHINGETFDEEEDLCYTCHKSGVLINIYDIKQFKDMGKYTGHMPWMTVSVHTYGEDLATKPRHVECQDCHNTHAVQSTFGLTNVDDRLPKALKGTWGVKITSWPVPNAPNYTATGAGQWREKPVETDLTKYPTQVVSSDDPSFEEYMLCYKCHASYGIASGGKRIVAFMNPNNASSHGFNPFSKNPTNFMNKCLSRKVNGVPVSDYLMRPGSPFNPNPDINVQNEPRRYKLTCSDCHGNSDPMGPKGPHGSNFDYMLKRDPKSITFCTDCHYSQAYQNNDPNYAPFSFGYEPSFHGRHAASGPPSWQYQKTDLSWTADPTDPNIANKAGVEYVAKVNQLFGSNWCRMCHYAGSYYGDTKWVSVHGENASWPTQRNWYGTNTYTVYRGLNGYGLYFSISEDGPGSASCATQNSTLGIRSCSWH